MSLCVPSRNSAKIHYEECSRINNTRNIVRNIEMLKNLAAKRGLLQEKAVQKYLLWLSLNWNEQLARSLYGYLSLHVSADAINDRVYKDSRDDRVSLDELPNTAFKQVADGGLVRKALPNHTVEVFYFVENMPVRNKIMRNKIPKDRDRSGKRNLVKSMVKKF